MILMIDNYDSFVYNLVRYFKELDEEIKVVRNDEITIAEIEKINPEIIVISPGPKSPDDAGISLEVIDKFKGKIPIFGVCLGHQVIAKYFGAKVSKANEPIHGKVYEINHDQKGAFKNIKNPLNVVRYHSLCVEKSDFPGNIEISALTEKGEIMAIRHKKYNIESVQFHPEAHLTENGHEMLKNFIENVRGENNA